MLSTTTLFLCKSYPNRSAAFWVSIPILLSSELIPSWISTFCVRMQMSLPTTLFLRSSLICFAMHAAPASSVTFLLFSELSHVISGPRTLCPNAIGSAFEFSALKYFFDWSKMLPVLLKTLVSLALFLIDFQCCLYCSSESLRYWLVSYKNHKCFGSSNEKSSSSSFLSNLSKRVCHLLP